MEQAYDPFLYGRALELELGSAGSELSLEYDTQAWELEFLYSCVYS